MSSPVYMIGLIDVQDFESYAVEYGMPVGQLFSEIGAEIIVASREAEVIEGEWQGNWTVVVKVPSAQAARELYDSDRYAPFRAARQERLANSSSLAIFPALVADA